MRTSPRRAPSRACADSARLANSRTGSVYVVKPGQHGPDEVAFTVELFGRVERALGLLDRTLKLGIMDEERRTSVNLDAAIAAARRPGRVHQHQVSGLHRRRDPHWSAAGSVRAARRMLKSAAFIAPAYEDANGDAGVARHGFHATRRSALGCGRCPTLAGDVPPEDRARARWRDDRMGVLSPMAATIHAMHYHDVDVQTCSASSPTGRVRASKAMLAILLAPATPSDEERPQRAGRQRPVDPRSEGGRRRVGAGVHLHRHASRRVSGDAGDLRQARANWSATAVLEAATTARGRSPHRRPAESRAQRRATSARRHTQLDFRSVLSLHRAGTQRSWASLIRLETRVHSPLHLGRLGGGRVGQTHTEGR